MPVAETDFDFYNTAAQVIPLIFVALAFEFRGNGGQFLPPDLLPRERGAPTDAERAKLEEDPRAQPILKWAAYYTVAMTLVLVAGEVVALHVIAYDDPWRPSRAIVGTSLTLGAIGIIVPIAILQYNTVSRIRRRQGRTKARAEREVDNVPRAAARLVPVLAAFIAAVAGLVPALIEFFR